MLLPDETVVLTWRATPGQVSAVARPDLSASITAVKQVRDTLLEKVGLPSSWSSRASECVSGGVAAYQATMTGKVFADDTWNTAVEATVTASGCYSLLPEDTRASIRNAAKARASKLFSPLKQFAFVLTHLRG